MKACYLLVALVSVAGAQTLPMPGQEPAKGLAPDTVVTKVDGRDVTVAQIQELLRNEPPEVQTRFLQDPTNIIGRLMMVRELVHEGEEAHIADQSPLKEQLQQMRIQAIATGMVNYVSNSFPVSMEDIERFYNDNKSRYAQGKIKAILVKFKPTVNAASPETAAQLEVLAAHTAVQRSEAEAKTRADEVLKKLREGGDFSKLAKEYSEDPASAAAGGDFGNISQTSSFPDDMKKAVLALGAGGVSDVIRTNTGFYIVQMVEKSPQPVAELIGPITTELRQNHMNAWFAELNARFQPKIVNQEFFLHPDRALGLTPNKPPASPAGAIPAPVAK